MGRSAYQADRDFRLAFDRIDRVFMGIAGWSLLTALFSPELDAEIERTEIAQPLLFAIQVALAEALARRGVTPAAVAGHSVGEVAAACVSGALTLDQGVRVIHARSTHQEVTRHLGGMAALLMPADQAAAAIADPRFAGIEIAAINSPRSITISGPSELLDVFAKHARKQRWALKRLDLDYPFHCALVEPIRDPLVGALAGGAGAGFDALALLGPSSNRARNALADCGRSLGASDIALSIRWDICSSNEEDCICSCYPTWHALC
jgi:acyl transferase domain-containing protein